MTPAWHERAYCCWPQPVERCPPRHTCSLPPQCALRTASGMLGRKGEWMDPRSGLVGVTTASGEHVITCEPVAIITAEAEQEHLDLPVALLVTDCKHPTDVHDDYPALVFVG